MAPVQPVVPLRAHALSLRDSLSQTQTDNVVIQMYLTALEEQPDIVQDLVPGLPATQARAREHGKRWTEQVLPCLNRTVTDVISYANQWSSYRDTMLGYARTIASPASTPEQVAAARTALDGMLGQVYASAQTRAQNAADARAAVRQFTVNLQEIDGEFASSLAALQNQLAGEKGVLAELDSAIDQMNSGIGRDAAIIVAGAVATIGGVVMIVVGAAVTFETAGASTAIILAGVALTAGGASALAAASADLDGKIKALGKLEKTRSEDLQMYAGVRTAIGQVSELSGRCDAAVAAAEDLTSRWQYLCGDLDTLRQAITGIRPGDYSVVHSIQYADADWAACLHAAQAIQANVAGGQVPVRRVAEGDFQAFLAPALAG